MISSISLIIGIIAEVIAAWVIIFLYINKALVPCSILGVIAIYCFKYITSTFATTSKRVSIYNNIIGKYKKLGDSLDVYVNMYLINICNMFTVYFALKDCGKKTKISNLYKRMKIIKKKNKIEIDKVKRNVF